MGFHEFGLTPLTGEPFMDPGFVAKLKLLDNHRNVKGYHFYTNFVIPNVSEIESLAALEKLQYMHISLYGHDLKSFLTITRRPESAYVRLVRNLETLRAVVAGQERRPWIRMSWRTTRDFDPAASPASTLHAAVARIQEDGGLNVPVTPTYNNWGGVITDDDVDGLDVVLGPVVAKEGPCALIFYRLIVLADGRVNACACRDVNATLVIGNIREAPLNWILSLRNERYARLIREQMANQFRSVCRSCDFYQRIDAPNVALESQGVAPDYRTLLDVLRQLRREAPKEVPL